MRVYKLKANCNTASILFVLLTAKLGLCCNMTNMLIAAVVIASSIIISSAQPSSQCLAAYNTTFAFDSSDQTCSSAYFNLTLGPGNYTEAERMMVCDVGQQCNAMIENIISICGDTVSQI